MRLAAAQVEQMYGSLDVAWGDVFRLRRDTVDLPASGAGDDLGSFRVLNFERAGNQLCRLRAVTRLLRWSSSAGHCVRLTLLAYGNSSQPGSPHRTDQLALFARRELRPVWLQRAEIQAHLKERKRF